MCVKEGSDGPTDRPMAVRVLALSAVMMVALIALIAAPRNDARAGASATEIDAAEQLIRSLGEQAIKILRDGEMTLDRREAELSQLLQEGFDLEFIGRFVLSREWRRLDQAQRENYLALFTEFLLKTYTRRLGGYADETLAIVGAKAAGKRDVMVQTEIRSSQAPPIRIAWRVRNRGDRSRIIDVVAEGISMALTQRDEFAAILRSAGFDGLLEGLRARTQRMTASAQGSS